MYKVAPLSNLKLENLVMFITSYVMCVIFFKTIYFGLLNVKISFKIYIIQCQVCLFTEVNLKFFGSQSSDSQLRESIVFSGV